MHNIYRGERISKDEFINRISEIKEKIEADLLHEPLLPQVVIEAVHNLSKKINVKEVTEQLVELEPRLKPYIYVIDVSSKNKEIISKLVEMVNAVVVWGSDEAISAIRQFAPPYLPIIEWGHRLSFA